MYDLLPLLWSRSGAPMERGTICCRCFGLEVVPPFKDVRFVAVALVSKWCPNSKMCDLLPLLWSRSGAPMLRCTICCRCFGLEAVPQFQDVRFVAVALVSKWCPNAKMYDLLPLPVASKWRPHAKMYDLLPLLLASTWCPDAKMYDLLPLLWSRSGVPLLRCTICCRCFGLEVVPQFQDVRFVAVALVSKLCPNAKMYDLLPLLWSRSGAPMLRCTICCRCSGLEVAPQC